MESLIQLHHHTSSFKFSTMSNALKFQVNCHRRSANYHPTVWEHAMIESFATPYTYDVYGTKLERLKKEARELLQSSPEPSGLVDSMQRLGIAYHFEEEIEEAMNIVGSSVSSRCCSKLHTTSLQFRLLREYGHGTSTDMFCKFKDGDGKWLESLGRDVTGLLSLYEASFYGIDGEQDLEEAGHFTVKLFQPLMERMATKQAEHIRKTLQLPLHWRMQRLEARNFINHLNNIAINGEGSVLLDFAKLDYNLVQSQHQMEMKELTKYTTLFSEND